MVRFWWTRLAYLLLVLTVLVVVERPDTQGAETRPLAADAPQDAAGARRRRPINRGETS